MGISFPTMMPRKIGNTALAISIGFAFVADARAEGLVSRPVVVVSPNPVVENQSIQLRVEVETSLNTVVFQPTFDASDFIQIGASPQASGSPPVRKEVEGVTMYVSKRNFTYILSPKKTGNLFIRNIRLKVGSQEVKSEDVMVKVLPDTSVSVPAQSGPADDEDETSNPAAPGYQGGYQGGGGTGGGGAQITSSPESLPASFNSDFTVHAVASKKKAFVGEPVVVEFWLYDFGGLQQMEVQKWPSFNGFWKEDLEIATRFEWEEAYVQNRQARRAFLSRYALYGIKPGKINLDRLVIKGQYVTVTGSNGFFRTQEMRTGVHGSEELGLEVLPLPTQDRPDKFSGAVGQFFLKLEADKTTVAQHTPITFNITVQGVGNFQAIEAMKLTLPPDFEVYESKTGVKSPMPLGTRTELMSQKTFQVTAIPRKAGTFEVAPLQWNYFDPEKNAYQKVSTSPLSITVTENAIGAAGTNQYAVRGSSPAGGESAVRPLKTYASGEADFPWTSWMNGAVLLALAANLYLGWGWLRKRAAGLMGELFQDPTQEAKSRLSKAKGTMGSAWLSALEDCLFALGQGMLGTNPRGMTRQEFESHWREKGLPGALFNRIALILDQLDQMRFGTLKSSGQDKALQRKLEADVEELIRDAAKLK